MSLNPRRVLDALYKYPDGLMAGFGCALFGLAHVLRKWDQSHG
jgi:hypothetical protein